MSTSNKLPLFAFPEELRFNESTRKQVLTIYNPYQTSLKYKILCTSPEKYRVMGTQGTLKSHCCIDVVISIASELSDEERDKFRIELYQGNKVVAIKQIMSQFSHTKENHGSSIESKEFKELPTSNRSDEQKQYNYHHHHTNQLISSHNFLTITIGILSLVMLLLPLDGESSSWPDWLHVTVNMKLIASFILGLVTMSILKM